MTFSEVSVHPQESEVPVSQVLQVLVSVLDEQPLPEQLFAEQLK